ncbi:MAG TPA: phage tail protein [Massilia sp.]|nr:phage tail protein [Massilia sp.]
MSEPYVGEIRMFAGNFAPMDWALCQGQLLSIAENELLYAVIGNTYGGDGQTTFALPDLRGRVPLHAGTGNGLSPRALGEQGGAENVTLTTNQLAAHTHSMTASRDPGNSAYTGANGVPASVTGTPVYGPVATPGPMMANVVGAAGGSQPHDNMAPYLCINFIIALYGLYPQQN